MFCITTYHYRAVLCENVQEAKLGYRGVIGRAGKQISVGVSLCLLPRRVLQSMWELLLRMILDAVAENRGVQVEFYNRFQYTVEVSDCILSHNSFFNGYFQPGII